LFFIINGRPRGRLLITQIASSVIDDILNLAHRANFPLSFYNSFPLRFMLLVKVTPLAGQGTKRYERCDTGHSRIVHLERVSNIFNFINLPVNVVSGSAVALIYRRINGAGFAGCPSFDDTFLGGRLRFNILTLLILTMMY
jgi:hypothetical protein